MGSKMKLPLNIKYSDDFQTPAYALYPLIPYLDPTWVIWECAEGKGNLTRELRRRGFTVIGTDIGPYPHLDGKDFLTWTPEHFDCIITNPPYSLKHQFLERCYELGKPFALLLPLTALESKRSQQYYRKYGLSLIIFNKRIQFETPLTRGSTSWFATAWFTCGLPLEKELMFVTLPNGDDKNVSEKA